MSDREILDATYICVGFNIIARIADALGFKIPTEELFSRAAKLLVIFGYKRLSGFWTAGSYDRKVDVMLVGVAEGSSHAAYNRLSVDQATFDPYSQQLARLRHAVLSGPASLSPKIRQAISENHDLSGVLGAYVKKVAHHAHTVTDEDIAELHQSNYTDDQIFEATISAALGAGLIRLESVLQALRGKTTHETSFLATSV